MRRFTSALFVTILSFTLVASAVAESGSLKGSPSSMVRQNSVAKQQGLSFVKTGSELDALVEEGMLVMLPGNEDYVVLKGVSYPFAVPEVRMFIERLAAQYREATGEKLVVTSLTRPQAEQPRNSHKLSVHPAGMAIDLRISQKAASRQWLESVLLKLERSGVLDVTRERYPPHYHVAIFPNAYATYLTGLIGEEAVAEAMNFSVEEPEAPAEAELVAEASPAPVTAAAAALPLTDDGERRTGMFLAVVPLLVILLALVGYIRKRP